MDRKPYRPSRALVISSLAALLLTVPACHSGAGNHSGVIEATMRRSPAIDPSDGPALFERHCAGCHGKTGQADTKIAAGLFPAPRAFTEGLFKLASTRNGVPTEEDLVRTLQRGMPGSTMMSFDWLPEASLQALALEVISLCGEEREPPAAPVDMPTPVAMTDDALAHGQDLFIRNCAACHGADGRGTKPPSNWAGVRELQWARDFTSGYMRGAPTHQELVYRIRAGMPGAHMPPTDLNDEDTALLVGYVQSLIPSGSDGEHRQWRHRLRASRVLTLPKGPLDGSWNQIRSTRLPTAPLWWREDAVSAATIRAAHDGENIVFQLSWTDPTRDDRALSDSPAGDGAALQFSADPSAPWLAMGGDEPVDIWHWHTFRPEDTAGALDLLEESVHVGIDLVPGLPGLTQPLRTGESVAVAGPEQMAQQRGLGMPVAVEPIWRDGRWTVTFTRQLQPRRPREVPLRAGSSVLVALAIWNGTVDKTPKSKSVTSWHWLEIEP
jgi:mono/diheme cytochrome c family protein